MTTATTTLPRWQKVFSLLPFVIVCGLVAYCWVMIFLNDEYEASWRQEVTLGAVIVNLGLYFYRLKTAILVTGLILLLGTFNLLAFFLEYDVYRQVRIMGLPVPDLQPKTLLLLLFYTACNFSPLTHWYLDYREKKR